MRPIDDIADVAFMEALKCVEYRLPRPQGLGWNAFAMALGLRYGLVGIAATHHLLLHSVPEDESSIEAFLRSWPHMVEEHFRRDVAYRLSRPDAETLGGHVASLSLQPLRQYLPLYRTFIPLDLCLHAVSRRFVREFERTTTYWWQFCGRKRERQRFSSLADESMVFALNFFARQEAGLPELREIALIGD